LRFDSATRALIHEASPNPATITWPKGEREPKIGRTYLIQSFEEKRDHADRELARRENHPETHREVMAGMHKRHHGKESPNAPKPKPLSRKRAGCERIYVISRTILDQGWEAKVVLYEDPDPILHLPIKARAGAIAPRFEEEDAGPSTATELEPEQRPHLMSRREREEAEEALRLEHSVSVDMAKAIKIEQSLNERRKRRRPAPLQEAAIARAKRRAADVENPSD